MTYKSIVGIADMKLVQRSGQIATYALGSCIGVCFYDATTQTAALLHIMLPVHTDNDPSHVFKYADTGIRETLRQMQGKGARRSNITAKIAGGAKMFALSGAGIGNIGLRNIESVKLVLRQEGIRLLAEDVGGNIARTVHFDVSTGRISVSSYGKPLKIF